MSGEGPCEFVPHINFRADNFMIDVQPSPSGQDQCCRICVADERCEIALFNILDRKCYLKKFVIGQSSSIPWPDTTACAVRGRAAPTELWGPAVWAKDEEKCRDNRSPPATIPAEIAGKSTGMPPILWSAMKRYAAEQRDAWQSLQSSRADLAQISPLLPLGKLHPALEPATTSRFFGSFPLNQDSGPCVAYLMDTTEDSDRSLDLSETGCEVHAFGCGSAVDADAGSMQVHDWCPAREAGGLQSPAEVMSLGATMQRLKHKRVDILRLQLGSLKAWKEFLPQVTEADSKIRQMSVRLCMADGDQDQSASEVIAVLLRLFDSGFWVVANHISQDKPSCRDFLLLHVGVKESADFPEIAWRRLDDLSRSSRVKLEKGLVEHKDSTNEPPFEKSEISLPIAVPLIDHDWRAGDGQGNKNLVGMDLLAKEGRKCVVYGMGIAGDPSFELKMANLGCETHAFDCTVDPKAEHVFQKPFIFHHWCIGEKVKEGDKAFGNEYLQGRDAQAMQFKTLHETMQELGHTSINVLKFDIEGFEWGLFENVIFKGAHIEQISFELHTMRANPTFVPQSVSACKDSVAVSRLFLTLYDLGFRVISREINNGDPACAEFVMLNVKY